MSPPPVAPLIGPLLALVERGQVPAVTPEGAVSFAWLIPLLPLLGFLVLVFSSGRLARRERGGDLAGWFASGLVALGFVLTVAIFLQQLQSDEHHRAFLLNLYTYLDVSSLKINADLLVDQLSVTMMLVVTGVGAVIHVYSIGYMHGDERTPLFFAYLNLFIFSMLILVMAGNFVLMFVGWELVGLCSYLLIGFWFEDISNAVAAKKAMIVNRVGDASFLIGLFVVFATFGSLEFRQVLDAAPTVLKGHEEIALLIGVLLLGGAVGKSAQIPLFVWLPDAMAGPTPVSALIHAATMVTAGVYMIVRTSAIYTQSHVALSTVAWVGMLTAFLAAVIAVQQDDIKRILAYSTISQLGYMFAGVGVGAFSAGIFHLITHAFFKALLFLTAGSVMHAVADRTDIWDMGGLWRDMRVTFVTAAVAVLAISGIPPFAGFFSKDHILVEAFQHGELGIWFIGVVTAAITAFYMGRWLFVPFFGRRRYEDRIEEDVHPHESPPVMTVPLVILAIGSLLAGGLELKKGGPLEHWLEPTFTKAPVTGKGPPLGEPVLMVISIIAGLAGLGLAALLYWRGEPERDPVRVRLGPIAWALRNALWVDTITDWLFVRGGGVFARSLVWFDTRVIDAGVNGVALVTGAVANRVRRAQFGLVRGYVAGLLVGTVAIVAFFFLLQVRV